MSREQEAAEAAAFIISRGEKAAGRRWIQERRRAPLPSASERGEIRLFADYRLFRIGEDVARALVAWADGHRSVHLLHRVPSPREVLSWQARGERCVSLVGPDAALGRHEDPLAFALHDLCHLEKFVDPDAHQGQVGFFRLVERAMNDTRWTAFEEGFDAVWREERDYVVADMNGSALFLFAALKMKLRMAVRRELARKEGRPCPAQGPLDAHEEAAFSSALDQLIGLFGWTGRIAEAARMVSTRRDAPQEARLLLETFEEMGGGPSRNRETLG